MSSDSFFMIDPDQVNSIYMDDSNEPVRVLTGTVVFKSVRIYVEQEGGHRTAVTVRDSAGNPEMWIHATTTDGSTWSVPMRQVRALTHTTEQNGQTTS